MSTVPFPSERSIEDYLWDELQGGGVCQITHRDITFSFRQLELVGYGVTDIVQVIVAPQSVEVIIVELKNESLKEAHLSQLARYMAGMRRFVRRYKKIAERKGWALSVKGVLAGPFSDSGDFVYLADLLPDIDVHAIRLSFENGFEVEQKSRLGWFSKKEKPECIKGLARGVFDDAVHLDRRFKSILKSNVTSIGRGGSNGSR